MNKRLFKRLAFIVPAVAFVTLIWFYRTGNLEPRAYKHEGTALSVTEATTWPEKTIPVILGTYVENIYDFEVKSETFFAEGWLWLKWPQEFQDLLDRDAIPIDRIIDFTNNVQIADFVVRAGSANPVRLPDGSYYQIFKYSGKFYAPGLDLRHFPFESVKLPLTFNLNLEFFAPYVDRIRLIADEKQSGLGPYIDITGYITTGQKLSELIYQFQTGFGSARGVTISQFSQVQMDVTYSRSVVSSILQLILPLIVVMAVVLLAPTLAGSLWDARIALPSTGLLTLVFLQQSYRDQLPTLPYVTFLDQIYTLCYATALAFFCLFVWSSNRLDQAAECDRPATILHINSVDRRFQIGLAIALLVLIPLGWFFPVK